MKRGTGLVGITAIKAFLIIQHVDNLKKTQKQKV